VADLRVDIASEFTGKAAFTKAQKATGSLDKAVGKLGKQIASVFALTKIVSFGKASVKAFAEDEAAANRLSVAVKNLGLAFAQPQIDNYISKLESSSAVLDDQLRPAFQALLTTTGSLTKSQELLALAIEASRASGIDLTTVSQDLANAYNGNTRGLRKYNLGLTKAQLTTVSFTEVQRRFNAQFSGANAAFLATYAGKLQILTVASENAKETIGKGLVDALALAGGKDGDVQDVATAMSDLSNYTADAVRGVGVLAGKLTDLDKKSTGGILSKLLSANFEYSLLGQLARLGNEAQPRPRANRRFMGGSGNAGYGADLVEKKRQADLKKLSDAQLKATKALTAEQKKQAALKKAGSIFDLEQIQIIAALQGNLSKEEETRLKAQFALLNGNATVATALTKQILMSQDATGNLYKLFQEIPDARNPFAYLEEYLNGLARKAATALSGGATSTAPVIPTNVTPTFTGTPFGQAGSSQEVAAIRQLGTPFGQAGGNGSGYIGTPFGQAQPIVVQIDGKAVASALQDSSMSGVSSSINRTYGSFAGR
jgi:hypothetical protein